MDHRLALTLELIAGLRLAPSTLSFDEWVRVLAPLSVRDARVVVLLVLHGLTHRECAERLEVSHGMVEKRRARAVRKLGASRAVLQLREAVTT